jgi:16S rRNA (cytidine1402-2'-O)-methyltransferase
MMEARGDGGERGFFLRGHFFAAPTLEAGLYVVATPIGHLSDVTLRALDTLAGADLIAAEDTRITRRLLTRYGIGTRMTSYHEHSRPDAHRRLLEALADGRAVALASDAGTPLISDPGRQLVADAVAAGYRVVPVPGPSAVTAALSAAGLPVESFLFAGFLSAKSVARRKRLAELAGSAATLVVYESPNRIAALLADAAAVLGSECNAVLAREITKLHETFDRGTLGELAERYQAKNTKGEIVLIIAPAAEADAPAEADVDALLQRALRSAGVKEAASAVAEATGLPRRGLYQRALTLRENGKR